MDRRKSLAGALQAAVCSTALPEDTFLFLFKLSGNQRTNTILSNKRGCLDLAPSAGCVPEAPWVAKCTYKDIVTVGLKKKMTCRSGLIHLPCDLAKTGL